jgi:hypothetical protein
VVQSPTQQSQMYTPGPPTSLPTSVLGFAQNEQHAMGTRVSATGHLQVSGMTLHLPGET